MCTPSSRDSASRDGFGDGARFCNRANFVESGEGTGDRGAGGRMCWMTIVRIVSVRTGNTVHVRLLLLSELSAVSSKCTSKNIITA